MNNIKLVKTDASSSDFQKLVHELDRELVAVDGDLNEYYHQFNSIAMIKYAIVAYIDNVAVGCGAIKRYDDRTMEIKRMYVPINQRKKGIASKILFALEKWAKELQYKRCILETGKGQIEALGLYPKSGYSIIDNYDQYAGVENSVCFEKIII